MPNLHVWAGKNKFNTIRDIIFDKNVTTQMNINMPNVLKLNI
jgi:hypothetical protein